MNLTCVPEVPVHNAATAEQTTQRATLERAFDTEVTLWFYTETGWSSPGSARNISIEDALADHFDGSEPVVRELSSGRLVALIPIAHPDGLRCAAVAEFLSSETLLVAQLVRAAFETLALGRELEQSTQRLTAYADHVSQECEQLCWLQSLATHIEVCDPHLGLQAVAENVLSELRELIGAQAILLVSSPETASSDDRTAAGIETRLVEFGHADVPPSVFRELVDRFGRAARVQPAIGNLGGCDSASTPGTSLQSFVLAPVATNTDHFGWLLAVNKQSHAAGISEHWKRSRGGSSELEFGTIEAGLMKAAGILLAAHARNAMLFRQKEALMVGVVRALINSIDAKDPYTFGHSDRVALMTKRLAQELGYDAESCEQFLLTGLLHDIGKIGVPDSVLQKPGKLTEAEFDLIKKHPAIGHNILKHLDQLHYVLDGVLHHHESYDGRGYPQQLAGEQIPMAARIIAVADAYDAMTSCRPYRQAMPCEKAEAILKEHAGKLWDARVVQAFFNSLDDIRAICRTERAHAEHILNGAGDQRYGAANRTHDPAGAATSSSPRHLFAATHPISVPRDAEFHTTQHPSP